MGDKISMCTPAQIVGQKIKNVRERKGWSQIQLANALGVMQGSVSACERGSNSLTIDTIIKFAEALECSPAELSPFFEKSKGSIDISYIHFRLGMASELQKKAATEHRYSDAAKHQAIVEELNHILSEFDSSLEIDD